MLTRRAKAYSSSCLQTVSLSPAILSQFILGVCAAAKDRKNQWKRLILKVQGRSSFKVIDVDTTKKSLSLVLVVIGSMPMPICNCFHERLAKNGKVTTFTGVPLFDALPLEPKKLRLGSLKSMFNAENFIADSWCLSQLISAQFALEMCLAAKKSIKAPILAFKVIQGHWIRWQQLPISD